MDSPPWHTVCIWDRNMWGHFGVSFRHWDLQSNLKLVTLLVKFCLSAIAMLPLTPRSLITLRSPLFWSYTNPWQILFFLASCSSYFIHMSVYPQQKPEFCTTESILCFLSVLLSACHWPRYKLFSFSLSTISFFPPYLLPFPLLPFLPFIHPALQVLENNC